jgi:hypothetical protein
MNTIRKVLMSFSDVKSEEKSASFKYGEYKVVVFVKINPWNGSILSSVKIGEDWIIQNKVCVHGEPFFHGFASTYKGKNLSFDLAFVDVDEKTITGNKFSGLTLGETTALYLIVRGDA